MIRVATLSLALLVGGATAAGCRGQTFEEPPFHLWDDMDWQPRYKPEGEANQIGKLFADGRAMRPLVTGTIPVGWLHDDKPLYTGMEPGTTTFVRRGPLPVDAKLLDRGQERFNVFCAPCHDRAGSGKGIVFRRGYNVPPTNLADDRVLKLPDGELFAAITKGVRNMPSYAQQIPAEDRWAIVAWVRVLQRSQHASINDVPEAQRNAIEPSGSPEGGK